MPARSPIASFALLLILAGTAAAAAEPWTVHLADGAQHVGTLVRIAPARYILQTDTALYELDDDDLDPRTFADRSRRQAVPERSIREIGHYDELHPDGTVTSRWTIRMTNTSRQVIAEVTFGLAPWEQLLVDQREYRDGYGNLLTPIFDPPRDQWPSPPDKRVQITLKAPVPVAPGEEGVLTGSETTVGTFRRDGAFVYRRAGDYAEDNLVWRKVRLPQGATIVSIEPQPSARFAHEGCEYVSWRRFYRKGEAYPLEVVYRLD